LNAEELTPFGYLIPLAVFLQGIFLAVNYWETRKRRFKNLSKRRVTNSALTVFWQSAAAVMGFGNVFNLIFGSVFGSLVANLQMLFDMLRHDFRQIAGNFSLKRLIEDAKSYKEFPIYGIPAILLNSLSSNVPIFILSFFFSTSIVGYYGFGFRVLRMPMDLIGVSIYQAFLPRAAQAYKDGNLIGIVRFTYEKLIKLSVFPLAVLAFSGGPIFSLIFGDQWRVAGEYIQIMSLYVIFWFIANPISSLFSILNKQRSLLIFNIFNFISRVISLTIGGFLASDRLAILLYTFSGMILYGTQNIVILKWAGIEPGESIGLFLSSIFRPLLFASSMVLVTYITDNTIIIFSYFVVLICGYYVWLFRNDKEFKELFSFNPKEKKT
jgi:lipopolysaccharide exporter